MSKIKVQQPVIHTPSFNRWGIQHYYIVKKLEALGIGMFPANTSLIFDQWYYYSDLEGWGKILQDLAFSSKLYKRDLFDCEDYALKAQVICAERFGLNSLRLCIGSMPQGKHGFNLFFHGDETGISGVMLWEPNDGFVCSGEAFEIGEYGYQPELVLIATKGEGVTG